MLEKAMRYIAGLKTEAMEPKVVEIQGKIYCNKELIRYDVEPMAQTIQASTLTALVDYIKNCERELRDAMIIHVKSPTEVELYSGLTKERKREHLFLSRANVPSFEFDKWYDQERFIIELQANFEVNQDLQTILKVSGNVEAKTTANYGDDGISQKTTIKQGIASKTDVIVPNPVTLVPYRTFVEIKQPPSEFVFHIRDINSEPAFKIVEAEGGLWKHEAMSSVKAYLKKELQNIPGREKITIIA